MLWKNIYVDEESEECLQGVCEQNNGARVSIRVTPDDLKAVGAHLYTNGKDAPGGDTREIVEANCRYFKAKNCNIAISATRTRWGSADALNEFAESKGLKVDWVPKSYEYNLSESTRTLCNKETAEFLLTQL